MNSLSSSIRSGSSSLNTNSQQLLLSGLQSHKGQGANPTSSSAEPVSALPRSKMLQQFVSNLFQTLEQNQQFIAEQQIQLKQERDAAASTLPQESRLSTEPPLLDELQQLVAQLNDQDTNNDGAPPYRQLQNLYQTTPWHDAYPNLPLGLLLQDLSQKLGTTQLQTNSRLGQFIDTQI